MSGEVRRARYQEIADDLRAKILNGTYPLDSALPSTAELMDLYAVSNTVIQRAINELKHDGVLEGHAGKGVFVLREPAPAEPSAEYTEIMRHVDALRQTMTETFKDLERRVTELEDAARRRRTRQQDS